MKEFRFTHVDGRTGDGWSSWAAIVAAIGLAEANALPCSTFDEIHWQQVTGNDEVWSAGDVILSSTGEKFGMMERLLS